MRRSARTRQLHGWPLSKSKHDTLRHLIHRPSLRELVWNSAHIMHTHHTRRRPTQLHLYACGHATDRPPCTRETRTFERCAREGCCLPLVGGGARCCLLLLSCNRAAHRGLIFWRRLSGQATRPLCRRHLRSTGRLRARNCSTPQGPTRRCARAGTVACSCA